MACKPPVRRLEEGAWRQAHGIGTAHALDTFDTHAAPVLFHYRAPDRASNWQSPAAAASGSPISSPACSDYVAFIGLCARISNLVRPMHKIGKIKLEAENIMSTCTRDLTMTVPES